MSWTTEIGNDSYFSFIRCLSKNIPVYLLNLRFLFFKLYHYSLNNSEFWSRNIPPGCDIIVHDMSMIGVQTEPDPSTDLWLCSLHKIKTRCVFVILGSLQHHHIFFLGKIQSITMKRGDTELTWQKMMACAMVRVA